MMKTLVTLSRALVIVAALAVVPAAAKAQSLSGSSASGVDGYRALAITAGVIGGAVVATIVTDGLVLPILAAGGRGGVSGIADQLISTGGTVFGAVAGGLYADDWYGKQ